LWNRSKLDEVKKKPTKKEKLGDKMGKQKGFSNKSARTETGEGRRKTTRSRKDAEKDMKTDDWSEPGFIFIPNEGLFAEELLVIVIRLSALSAKRRKKKP
jgi:hypothetical protein